MRRVHMMVLWRRRWLWFKLCNMRCNYFAFPFMLQLCENFFADAVLVEFGLNGGNDFVYDRAVDARLKKCLCYQTELLQTSSGE